MRKLLYAGFGVVLLCVEGAFGQTPPSVLPGTQVDTYPNGSSGPVQHNWTPDSVKYPHPSAGYVQTVTSCGGQSFSNGAWEPLEMTVQGNLCTNATSGGTSNVNVLSLPPDVPITGSIPGAAGFSSSTPGIQTIYSGGTSGNYIDFKVAGVNTVTLTYSGTWSATLKTLSSNDNLSSYSAIQGAELLDSGAFACSSTETANISNLYFNVTGMTDLLVGATAYASGTPIVTGVSSGNVGPLTGCGAQSPGNSVDGGGSSTGTGTFTILAASGNALLHEYLTGLQCGRSDTGTSAITVAVSDGTKTRTFVLPNSGGGGGNNVYFTSSPISWALNTAVTAAFSAGVTTGYCNAQGFDAP